MDDDDPKETKSYPSEPPLETDVTVRGLHERGVVDVALLARSLAVTEENLPAETSDRIPDAMFVFICFELTLV